MRGWEGQDVSPLSHIFLRNFTGPCVLVFGCLVGCVLFWFVLVCFDFGMVLWIFCTQLVPVHFMFPVVDRLCFALARQCRKKKSCVGAASAAPREEVFFLSGCCVAQRRSLSGRSPFCQLKLSEKSQIHWKVFPRKQQTWNSQWNKIPNHVGTVQGGRQRLFHRLEDAASSEKNEIVTICDKYAQPVELGEKWLWAYVIVN